MLGERQEDQTKAASRSRGAHAAVGDHTAQACSPPWDAVHVCESAIAVQPTEETRSSASQVPGVGDGRCRGAGTGVGQAVGVLDGAQDVVVVDRLRIRAGFDRAAYEDRGDLVVVALV